MLRQAVLAASKGGDKAWEWILRAEAADATLGELSDVHGYRSLDAELAAAQSKVAKGEVARVFQRYTEMLSPKPIRGRQLLMLLHQHYQTNERAGAQWRSRDLSKIRLQGDADLERFLNSWLQVLSSCADQPTEEFVLDAFLEQLRKAPALNETVAYCDRQPLGHHDKSYNFLLNSVNMHLIRLKKEKNRQALEGTLQRRIAPAPEKKPCHAFLAGNCKYGDSCKLSHDVRPDAKGKGRGKNRPKSTSGRDKRDKKDKPRDGEAGERKQNPCYDYSHGKCKRGKDCPYAHRKLTDSEKSRRERYESRSPTPKKKGPKVKVCPAFLKGNCHLGKACTMSHAQADADKAQKANQAGNGNEASSLGAQRS